MTMDISFDVSNYQSNSVKNGRIIKDFFKKVTNNIFNMSNNYMSYYQNVFNVCEIPILYGERNINSLLASAVNAITPVHLSEWTFSKNNSNISKDRRVDLWCLYKNNRNSKFSIPINFFIELKTGWYCLNSRSDESIEQRVKISLLNLIDQLRTLKVIKPEWNDANNVYLGLMIIQGYYIDGCESYTEDDLFKSIHSSFDLRTVKNYLISTLRFPDDVSAQWERDKCRFVSIVGIPILP